MYTDMHGQKWYKGNLHTHTTRSDGKVSYEDAVMRYKKMGYDFLSITDHWVTSETVEEENFLLLSGCEYNIQYTESCNEIEREVIIHINGIGFDSPPQLENRPALRGQAIVDAVRDAGGIAIINHPEWSRNLVSDIANLRGLSGIEIFNTVGGSAYEWHYDYSGFHVDQLALAGLYLPAFACDDVHFYAGDEGKSFIMLRAFDLSKKSVMDAIINRHFFASQGPWLEAQMEGRFLKVNCTPVNEIRVYSSHYGGWHRKGNDLTNAEFQLSQTDTYYRVEVTDKEGNRAFTSPVKIA